MQCGRETMCSPCWDASPDEAWAICASVFDLQGELRGGVVGRETVEAAVVAVCVRTKAVEPNDTIRRGVETRLLEDDIETWPLRRELTELEIDE